MDWYRLTTRLVWLVRGRGGGGGGGGRRGGGGPGRRRMGSERGWVRAGVGGRVDKMWRPPVVGWVDLG